MDKVCLLNTGLLLYRGLQLEIRRLPLKAGWTYFFSCSSYLALCVSYLRVGLGPRFLPEQHVVIAVRVKRRVEIDLIDGLVLDVLPQYL